MKKSAVFISVLVILSILTTAQAFASKTEIYDKVIKLKIDSPIINIDGEERILDNEGTVPIIENGRTLVPLRAIFEAFSAEVLWDDATQTVTGVRGNTEIKLTVGENYAYKNGSRVRLDVPPKILNGRTMVPLRFISESLGADVEWFENTQTIEIVYTGKFLTLDGITVRIGDELTQVETVLGKADRTDPSGYDFEWHVYNSDYSRFIMVGIKNGITEALYTNSKGFKTNAGEYGDVMETQLINIQEAGNTFYIDRLNGNKMHACLIMSDNVTALREYGEEFFLAQELENFDVTNAFRANYGLQPLGVDESARLTARRHSQDMADRNYFSHTNLDGLSPKDRYVSGGGTNRYSGENIYAGSMSGINAFNARLNSDGHRRNMPGSHKYLGVGLGQNSHSGYRYYLTQLFSS